MPLPETATGSRCALQGDDRGVLDLCGDGCGDADPVDGDRRARAGLRRGRGGRRAVGRGLGTRHARCGGGRPRCRREGAGTRKGPSVRRWAGLLGSPGRCAPSAICVRTVRFPRAWGSAQRRIGEPARPSRRSRLGHPVVGWTPRDSSQVCGRSPLFVDNSRSGSFGHRAGSPSGRPAGRFRSSGTALRDARTQASVAEEERGTSDVSKPPLRGARWCAAQLADQRS